ncbi:MAG: sigma-70 family RNA polymerase sigma factor [Deltaproteobacteria bacterium]|nr:sigma-70 family RNA polymerase sigma factor [Deltaproteobacteria bacterium]
MLQSWGEGDPDAFSRLVPMVYKDLHSMASFFFHRESESHTLQPTALVNEVYLRMFREEDLRWDNRRQFFGFASKLMRNILVDHARSRQAIKRGNGAIHIPLEDVLGLSIDTGPDLLAINEALELLGQEDQRQSEIVHMRFFVGLTVEEIAQVLETSPSTVKREWRAAKFWLHRHLAQQPAPQSPTSAS